MTHFSKNAAHYKIPSNSYLQLNKKDGTKKSPRNSSESCLLWKLKTYLTLCQKRCILTFSTWTTRCLPAVCFSCKSFIVSLYIIKYWNEDLQHVYDSLLVFLKSFIFDWIPKKVPIIRIKKYSWVHCFRGCLLFNHTSHDINFRVGMMMMSEDAFLSLLFFMSPPFPAVNWPLHH